MALPRATSKTESDDIGRRRSAGDEQRDDVAGGFEHVDGLVVRHAVQTDAVDGNQLIAALQTAVGRRRAVRKHALDDDREVAAVAAEAADDGEAETVRTTTKNDLTQRLADRTAATRAAYTTYK